ncbi:CpsD/CapB family tyrosine-protein kinase [Bradyrhizobium denitrificans]|uniref:CpsD/CapB family tyrosine-protein kinase n=1 Tax=Bradyrhizobium denitrificans TaxID=2734912 RepID=A0ABS5GAU3_9BRAD|nr:CpsD/CapB family tyrosine-protein kinase [Bradyrhizobium denitrificans]
MDPIRQALERARSARLSSKDASLDPFTPEASAGAEIVYREVKLSAAHLEAKRIVAHDPMLESGRYYDMLRTQVLQAMDDQGWQILAITSPTAGCGKTVTACNLAMSIARLPERSVLLIDMDMMKPKVADYLGIEAKNGILSVLQVRAGLSSTMVRTSIQDNELLVLPGEVCRSGSAEWMASQAMTSLIETLKRDFRSYVIILDLPPVLIGDDVLAILPWLESILLVTAVGTSTLPDIKECYKHLKSAPIVRVLVNKVSERTESYYGYGYHYGSS